ncbi:MAG: S16 family serine protease, partial [Acidobacteriota bacterium]
SMQAALTWVRSHANDYKIDTDFFSKSDVHVHVPAGAIPKDGPSAGVTMVTSLVSALTGRSTRPRWAMTGEITLSGMVLPVGGLKEKILAAKRAHVEHIILPGENEPNVRQDLSKELLGDVKLHFVKKIEDVLELALEENAAHSNKRTPSRKTAKNAQAEQQLPN